MFAYNGASYLIHYGVSGQKWGVRRYQNEDGSLTPEGIERYLAGANKSQKIYWNHLTPKEKKRMVQKMDKGKTFNQANKELNRERAAKTLAIGLAAGAAWLYANDYTRPYMKAGIKSLFNNVKNSSAVQKGRLYIQRAMKRRSMVKNGGVVLGKNDFSIRDFVPFGGHLA